MKETEIEVGAWSLRSCSWHNMGSRTQPHLGPCRRDLGRPQGLQETFLRSLLHGEEVTLRNARLHLLQECVRHEDCNRVAKPFGNGL